MLITHKEIQINLKLFDLRQALPDRHLAVVCERILANHLQVLVQMVLAFMVSESACVLFKQETINQLFFMFLFTMDILVDTILHIG